MPLLLTLETQQLALEDAFRKLTPGKCYSTGIPYETLIPGIARELLIMKREDQKKDQARKSLKNLISASARMIEVLEQVPPEVLDKLIFPQPNLKALQTALRLLNIAACKAEVPVRRGAREKIQPSKIAQTVGWHYYCLTDQKPTLSKPGGKAQGAFFDLLTSVYNVLGVHASAENQANQVIKDWFEIKERFQGPNKPARI